MNKKVLIIVAIIAVILVAGTVIFVATREKGPKTIQLTQTEKDYIMTVEVPEGEEKGTSKYEITDNEDELKGFCQYMIVGDKIKVEFEKRIHTFQTNIKYEEEHGEISNPTFKQYVEYIKNDPYGYFHGEETVREFETEKRKGVEYVYFDSLIRVLDTDDILDVPVFMTIKPLNEEDNVEELMKDPEIKAVVDSIDFKLK